MAYSAPPVRTALADTYPLPSTATFRTGIGALFDYSTGLLGASGNPPEARDALGIGSAFGFRSRVRNGNFVVNQRRVSGTVTLGAGVYGHDGWKAGASGCTYTFATSGNDVVLTISAGSLIQTIEGALIEGGNYIMSWTGTAQGKIGAGSYAATGVAATGVTAAANLNIEFNTGTLSKVQFEPGTVVTPFERRHISQELAFNRRYLPAFFGSAVGQSLAPGMCTTTTTALVFFQFDVEPRVPPNAVSSSGSAYLLTASGSATASLSAFTYSTASTRMATCTATVSGLVAGNATMLSANSSATLILFTGCEL